jgi:predicted DCC family thiol-disulfide oxidoreductase YuxK
MEEQGMSLVVFDDECALCDGSMQFLIQRDHFHRLHFTPLQGSTAKELDARHGILREGLSSVVFVEGFRGSQEKVYTRSTAALRILGRLGFPWSLSVGFLLVPSFVRNFVYQWIAQNRYRWFGRYEACLIPSPEVRERFLP